LALGETTFAKLEELLTGPIGIVTSNDDPVAAAKILVKYAERYDNLKITGGVLDGAVLPATELDALAKLPSREVLLAQFLGLLQAPASQLLRTIQEPAAQVVRLLGALERSKKEQESAA
jgi:large subunit ribosomal protein L10